MQSILEKSTHRKSHPQPVLIEFTVADRTRRAGRKVLRDITAEVGTGPLSRTVGMRFVGGVSVPGHAARTFAAASVNALADLIICTLHACGDGRGGWLSYRIRGLDSRTRDQLDELLNGALTHFDHMPTEGLA